LPIRLRLTAAFALAMAIVLALAGVFVYLRVASDLGNAIDDALRTRVDDLARSIQRTGPTGVELGGAQAEGSEDNLTEIIAADGTLVDTSEPAAAGPVLTPDELAEARTGLQYFDAGPVEGLEGDARLLARPLEPGGESLVLVVGASTGDRAETLSGLVATFAVGAPLALLLASALGYALASLAMRPVEAMRRRAEGITLERSGERLPLPDSADEIASLGRTLNEMLARIEGSVERERAFVADASHELRTPLAVLRSELELGLRPDRDQAEARAAMRSAAEEVDRLQALTDDLLALERSDDARLPIERRRVAVAELLERTRARFAARAGEEGRAIRIEAPRGLEAEIDLLRIEGALSNLIDNSLRYGGGDIVLRASGTGAGDARLEVSDGGPGFPEGFAEVAFERFSRAESGRTTRGNGLGLAIVKAIAEAHGGRAEVVPGEGGATVAIDVPAPR